MLYRNCSAGFNIGAASGQLSLQQLGKSVQKFLVLFSMLSYWNCPAGFNIGAALNALVRAQASGQLGFQQLGKCSADVPVFLLPCCYT